MVLLWIAILLIWGLFVGFLEIPTLAWLLLVPFAYHGACEMRVALRRAVTGRPE